MVENAPERCQLGTVGIEFAMIVEAVDKSAELNGEVAVAAHLVIGRVEQIFQFHIASDLLDIGIGLFRPRADTADLPRQRPGALYMSVRVDQ